MLGRTPVYVHLLGRFLRLCRPRSLPQHLREGPIVLARRTSSGFAVEAMAPEVLARLPLRPPPTAPWAPAQRPPHNQPFQAPAGALGFPESRCHETSKQVDPGAGITSAPRLAVRPPHALPSFLRSSRSGREQAAPSWKVLPTWPRARAEASPLPAMIEGLPCREQTCRAVRTADGGSCLVDGGMWSALQMGPQGQC